jgi:probable phosphoglycerate mutase
VRDGVGVDDPPLTERGRLQARLVAEHLRDWPADELFVSPLRRAQQTAEPVAEVLGLQPATLDWLAEITTPPFEGTPAEQVERVFTENRHRPAEAQWEGLPGGESFRDFHLRVTAGIRRLLSDHEVAVEQTEPRLYRFPDGDPRRVVVVAHAGTNAVALTELLGMAPVPWEWERFLGAHASVAQLQPLHICGAHAFGMARFGDTSHLPAGLRTG